VVTVHAAPADFLPVQKPESVAQVVQPSHWASLVHLTAAEESSAHSNGHQPAARSVRNALRAQLEA
jgi:hypothetical protein